MKTVLSQFSAGFQEAVHTLDAPLEHALWCLREAPESTAVRGILPDLEDAAHRFQRLQKRVADQQAYVLIFGPLKSGKSTLMNALAGSYVSEVTALPAYPCMVFVGHSGARNFTMTRYNGESQTFSDLDGLRVVLNWAHAELAGKIRETEQREVAFDPAAHFPEAVKRVDVRVPAKHLENSGAVLVDTPGLYTRMKFGYDQMTREFRDTAACAIFVVKTDNLFLEQVFEEFQDLLKLFSRVFLVVNLDTTKRDLRPDGTLGPSLEREKPGRIIEAFEDLVMTAPIQAAEEEGRLKIYPIDLLRAASCALLGREEDSGDREEKDFAARQAARFQAFSQDLVDYLDSNEHLTAFLGDSLRQLRFLMEGFTSLTGSQPVRDMEEETSALEGEKTGTELLAASVRRLSRFDWKPALAPLRKDLLSGTTLLARKLARAAREELKQAVADWFQTKDSFEALALDSLEPIAETFRATVARATLDTLRRLASGHLGGVRVPPPQEKDLEAAGLQLQGLAERILASLAPYQGFQPASFPLRPESVPVRKSLLDWLFFRSRARVRLRLFGSPENPGKSIPPSRKSGRLGAAGREAIETQAAQLFLQLVRRTLDESTRGLHKAFTAAMLRRIQEHLSREERATAAALEGIQSRLAILGTLRAALEELRSALERTLPEVDSLSRQFLGTERETGVPAAEEGASPPEEKTSPEELAAPPSPS